MRSISVSRVIIPFLLVGVLSLLGGWGIVQYGANFQNLLFLVLLIAMVVIIAMGKKALQVGFVVWIWMFILGYRTIHLTSYFPLHPLIIFLALLFLILLFALKSAPNVRLKLPRLLWVFSIFWLWGFIPGALRGFPWSKMISYAINFFLLIPLFMIILYLSRESGFWKSATLTFLWSGALISLLGAIEFYSPQFRSLLPGLIQVNVEGLQSFSGFERASFAFFGATPAVIISALALPMVWLLPKYYKSKIAVFFSFVLLAILGIGIYISGTRVAWLMLFCASFVLAYFGMGLSGIGLSAIFWGIFSRFFSAEVWTLIFSLYTPFVSAQISDPSLQIRFTRQQNAFILAIQNPFGVGWSGSGWVHGDFTQVAANLGILAGIIFLAWYLHTLFRAWKIYRKYPKDWMFQAILTSFILGGIILLTEGVQVLPQFVMPVWFVWGLMESYLQQKNSDFIIP